MTPGSTSGATTSRLRLILVDDHEMARKGLRAMLSIADWIDVVGEADSCDSGLALAGRLHPDVAMLDIRMPGVAGLACLEPLARLDPPVATIIVTLYDDRRYVLEALRRGAAGYLLKEASTAEVIATLETVVDGRLAISPDLLREALAAEDQPSAEETARLRAQSYQITDREHEVLVLVAQGMTNKEIGGNLSITEDTVKKHVQNLIWKLRAADRTQAAITALRLGMLETPE